MTYDLQLIDTHAHLNFQSFKKDADDVIRRAFDAQTEMIIVGGEFQSSKRAVEFAEKYDKGVYAAVGLHPVHLQDNEFEEEGQKIKMKAEKFDRAEYEKLAKSKKVVAIGEIGLDYRYLPQDNAHIARTEQQLTLVEQLKLAHKLDLPVIIHCREAHEDILKVLKNIYKRYKGVMHCYSGDWDLAWKYFNLGFLISFTGVITFNHQWDEIIRKCPLDKLMIETDCPFMTPVPYRGKRNEPLYVKYVAERIADIKGVKVESVAKATTENARRLFGI